ncbi:WecB/TagA/CpsF family glycosyltransferase [Clostridium cylindrosporum]|uniref:N-acetylglucosaminyldiphosphoundecaprenol N-acetyl-beta-D-mannosaminyltransferase n=1 Tax=Clostridium cylindrosporum DSM 605 TaxID=1121307 RepID=A0A0J8DEI8_CLOCY|nr:WecB/TagA/CpsF family glycosyltransferase [Clostridium cylindrosporum]KMT22603.1 putative N-acetylmannosaminyltransferase TagA [Clostridium cylindrosporum DSM 605]
MKNEKYLGVEVSTYSMDEILLKLDNVILENKKTFIVAINPEKIMKAQDDNSLLELINSADLKIPDGSGVVLASRLSNGNIKSRVTGIDLMKNICIGASKKKYKIFLLGAKPEVARRASEKLKEEINDIQIVGVQDGYFKDEEKVINEINDSGANILFVALGSPMQEKWITKNMDRLNCNIFMGVGGSFDVICGDINRAPVWMQKCGSEWVYRLIKEPRRISRVKVLPMFILKTLSRRD